MPTNGEILAELRGQFKEYDRRMEDRHSVLLEKLVVFETRITALEAQPAKQAKTRTDRIHQYAGALFAGSFSGVGVAIFAHLRGF